VSEKRLPLDAITVRVATEADREALESFSCSGGLHCEDEVEEFIRTRILDTHDSEVADYRLLLAFDEKVLAGVIAHRMDLLTMSDGSLFYARLVQVIAVGGQYRGSVFIDGSRLSDRLLATMIDEVFRSTGSDIFTAIIASENDRSIELIERCGSWTQVAYDYRHVRFTGRFKL
jgi:hypothetical protein